MIRGGTGGNNTKTGANFEFQTDLKTKLSEFYDVKNGIISLNGMNIAIYCPKRELYRFLSDIGIDWRDHISSQLFPDEAIFISSTRTLFIIEKKYQEVYGSVDEKLQTCDFKKSQYQKLVASKNIKVEYIYLLNDWFKRPKYRDTLTYIKEMGCHYYFNELPLQDLNL